MVVTRGLGVLGAFALVLAARAGAAEEAEENEPPGKLNEAREILYAGVEGGITHIGLVTFADHGLTRVGNTMMRRSGPVYGAGLGVRWEAFTFGVRGRGGTSRAFDHWSLGIEAAFRPELGQFVPYVGLGANYFHVDDVATTMDLSREDFALFEGRPIRGFGPRVFGGFDYRFARVLSAGITVSGDVLFLRREGIVVGDIGEPDGTGVGGGVAATAVLGVHI
jgi:hypothetical protein